MRALDRKFAWGLASCAQIVTRAKVSTAIDVLSTRTLHSETEL